MSALKVNTSLVRLHHLRRNLGLGSEWFNKIPFNSSIALHNFLWKNIPLTLFHTSGVLDVKGVSIKMPSLSPTMMEGTIVKWLKKEGETIKSGDIICDIQTDKAVVSFEIEEEGILAKILVDEDSKEIKIGTVIAVMVDEGEDWRNVEMPEDTEEPATAASQTEKVVIAEKPSQSQIEINNFGPSVRLLLEKYGLSPSEVPAQGPHGILLKGDVLKFIKERNLQSKPPTKVEPPVSVAQTTPAPTKVPPTPAAATPGDSYNDLELTNMRRTIAKRLLQSKSTIAHTYSTLDCCIDNLLQLRKKFKKDGSSVSVNDFIIKAAAVALQSWPEVNCVWEGGKLVHKKEVDISVAVATDSGLITPIVRSVQSKGLSEISNTVKEMAARARENKLKLEEFQGGTFTISNLGMFGIKEFTAIINPPQCAILAVGGGRIELSEAGTPETRMMATLSYDQAAISDDVAAMFLETLKELLEKPQAMLLGSKTPSHRRPVAASV